MCIRDRPAVVAINTRTKEIFEVGERAKLMIGRTPNNLDTIRPLKNGVIADYEITEKMLGSFYKRVSHNRFFSSPRVIILSLIHIWLLFSVLIQLLKKE